MHMKWHSGGDADAAMDSIWSWIPPVVIAATVIAVAGHAILYGPALRARAEQLEAAQIDKENRALCEKLGMPHGSAMFGACAGMLSEARRLHAERIAIESAGIL
jgi:hypothetical protein